MSDELQIENLNKLKVNDLRAELTARGLDSKGVKAVLVERLREYLESGGANESEPSASDEIQGQESDDEVEEINGDDDVDQKHIEGEEDEESGDVVDLQGDLNGANDFEEEEGIEDSENVGDAEPGSDDVDREDSPEENVEENQEGEEPEETEPQIKEENDEDDYEKEGAEDAPMFDLEADDKITEEFKQEKDTADEVKQEVVEPEVKQEVGTNEVKQEESDTAVKQEQAAEPEKTETRRGEKRSRFDHDGDFKRARRDPEPAVTEDEPEFDETAVVLDWYNSDLSLKVEPDARLSAEPMTSDGFGYCWHGVRATYGYTKGRVYYEVKVEDYIEVPQIEAEEQHPHVMRVGWSVNDAGLVLGEEPLSWGYGGTAKASTNLKFKDYGKVYGKGDIVGCFLDLDAEPMVMSFTVNGEHQGICYEVPHADIGDDAMFPHILTKNCKFKVNFGAMVWTNEGVSCGPWAEVLEGYTPCAQYEERVRGTSGPEKREECEVIMMVGLPAAGKTTWVNNYVKENRHMKYNVLGTNDLIDRMKVMGLPRRRNYAGRWENLIEMCTRCLNTLLRTSYKRRRNFIIDQTNVYPSAQKRKIRGFEGMKRRAVIICPTDEDLKARTEKRTKEEGKDVPDTAVLEMKANFKLPEKGQFFDEIEHIELQPEEAEKVIQQYNKEGEDAGFVCKFKQQQKNDDRRNKGSGGGNDRRGGGRYEQRGRGDRGGGGGGKWDRNRGGDRGFDRRDRFRDNRDRRDGGFNRRGGGDFGRRDRGGGGFNRDQGGGFGRPGGFGGRDGGFGGRDGGFGGRDGGFGGRDGGFGGRDGGFGGRDGGFGGRDGGGFNRNQGGGYGRNQGGFGRDNRGGGGFNRDRGSRDGGYGGGRDRDYNRDNRGGGYNRGDRFNEQGGGYNRGDSMSNMNKGSWGGGNQQGYSQQNQSYGQQGYGQQNWNQQQQQQWPAQQGQVSGGFNSTGYNWNQQYYNQQGSTQQAQQTQQQQQYWGAQQGYGQQGTTAAAGYGGYAQQQQQYSGYQQQQGQAATGVGQQQWGQQSYGNYNYGSQ